MTVDVSIRSIPAGWLAEANPAPVVITPRRTVDYASVIREIEAFSGRSYTVTPDLPHDPAAHRSARRFLQLTMEVLAQRRPSNQLRHLAAGQVQWWLQHASSAGPRSLKLTALRASQPHDTALEAAAVCREGATYRALAARFEHSHGAWACTSIRLI